MRVSRLDTFSASMLEGSAPSKEGFQKLAKSFGAQKFSAELFVFDHLELLFWGVRFLAVRCAFLGPCNARKMKPPGSLRPR